MLRISARIAGAIFGFLVLLAAVICAPGSSTQAHAMTWQKLTNADILKRSALVIEGVVEEVFVAPDSATRGFSDRPRDPAARTVLDAAAVIHVRVTEVFKGRPEAGLVSIVYFSDFGDRDHSNFTKYHAPRRFERGQRVIFTLKKAPPEGLGECSAPPEAQDAKWAFALPFIYDQQIQAPAFVAEARRRAQGASGHRADPRRDRARPR